MAAEITRARNVLLAPNQVTELRALGVSATDRRRPHTVSGSFDLLNGAHIESTPPTHSEA